ncbi:chromosomal replication initiator protein DnaA [Alphaproteobacteria bacterium]|nr:chromosomal replication initiator protein DnaA [Alphaproteobacteria bacterium]
MIQEVFGFHKIENLSWSDFVDSSENSDAIKHLMQWPAWNTSGLIIYGESGVGKTHIANLWAQTANAIYVLKQSLNQNPRTLFETECNFIIDNFDDFLEAKNYDWIFHFFNISKEKSRYFLLLSRTHPSMWKVGLNDLRSRLFTLPAINIKNPDDELLLKIAKKLSKDLEIMVSDDTLRYIIHIVDRNVTSVSNTLKILDKIALQKQKSITIPFVKKYIA